MLGIIIFKSLDIVPIAIIERSCWVRKSASECCDHLRSSAPASLYLDSVCELGTHCLRIIWHACSNSDRLKENGRALALKSNLHLLQSALSRSFLWVGEAKNCCPRCRVDRTLLSWVQNGPGTVTLGAERTRNCCHGCRADSELLPWLQSGPGTVALAAEPTGHCFPDCRVHRWQSWAVFCVCCDSATLSHATRLYLLFLSHPLRMYHCNEVSLAWLSPVTWFVTLATRYMGWLRIERRSWRIRFPLVALWPLR